MANLGSEVMRLQSARGKPLDAQASLSRCMSILNEYEKTETTPSRKPEISMLRRVLADFGEGKGEFDVTEDELEDYFMPFARRFLAMH